jgi:hypothetical protein
MANELGRLAAGVGDRMSSGTNTIFFISKNQVPTGRKATYANAICNYRLTKDDPWRVRLTVGGDKLDCPGDPGAPAASLLKIETHHHQCCVNTRSKISDDGYQRLFFKQPDGPIYEYMKIPLRWIPKEIIDQYGLANKAAQDGHVYIGIRKGMYGLKQAARIAYDRLVVLLAPHGYHPIRHSPGLWKHKNFPTVVALCVDDFGIKYNNFEHAHHLINTLKKYYTISTDWTGGDYCGLHLQWNYMKRFVDVSMPECIQKILHKFQHPPPAKAQHTPHDWTRPTYGAKVQYAKAPITLPTLDKAGTQCVQAINGTLLYYARAVDPTMLPALNEISAQQASPTALTTTKCNQLLDYAATYPNAVIRYHASQMVLHVDTDAAYLVLPKARSRIAGHYFLSDLPPPPPAKPTPRLNGPIHTECRTLHSVVASAAEAECGGLFHNSQTAIPIRNTHIAIGHPQPPTPIKTDNTTALGIVTSLMNPKRFKTWDMRYHWIEDRVLAKHIRPYWDKGIHNWADYFTKNHPPVYHNIMLYKYLQKGNNCNASSVHSHRIPASVIRRPACEGVLLPGNPEVLSRSDVTQNCLTAYLNHS